MTDNQHNQPDDANNLSDDALGASASEGYQPSYSKPNYTTTDQGDDWEVPQTSEPVSDDDTTHASAPDASPLIEDEYTVAPNAGVDAAPTPPAAPWWDSGQNAHGGATAASPQGQQPPYAAGTPRQQPPYAAGPPGQPGGQQWGGQGQQYQAGPPMGGMPPQPYTGGYAPMSMGPNNPNWLAGPSEQGRNTLQLDYWLSVFFSWIPALIFFLTEKDKNRLTDEHTKELLNFNITRIIVGAFTAIPIIGWIVGGIGSIVLFVMAILGAMSGPDEYANGRTYQFPLTFRFIK